MERLTEKKFNGKKEMEDINTSHFLNETFNPKTQLYNLAIVLLEAYGQCFFVNSL